MSKRAADEEAPTSDSKVQRTGEDGEAPAAVTCTAENFWEVQIEAIYRRRNPHKLAGVPDLLKKYAGKEAVLYAKVCKTYDLDPKKFYADEKAWEEYEQDVLQDGNDNDQAAAASSSSAAATSSSTSGGAEGAGGGGGGVAVPSLFGPGSGGGGVSVPSLFGIGPLGSNPSPVPNLFGNSAPLFNTKVASKKKAGKRRGQEDEDEDDDDDSDSEEDSDGRKRGSKAATTTTTETKSDAGECKTQ
mmetsp:Transcript_23270/g.51076  ORF Transcript_23270/g.51076 Transcript_23270/m.51076 type:complete len:244 (-) Transcript_23270:137-868(-)